MVFPTNLWILFLCVFSGCNRSCNIDHTFLTIFALIGCASCLVVHENVVFHKANEVSLNHARWLVTFIHDLRPFEVFINKISKDLESSNEIMLTLTEWYRQHNFTTYHSTFKSLNDEIGLLNDT